MVRASSGIAGIETRALSQEGLRVLKSGLPNGFRGVSASAEFNDRLWYGEWIAVTPVTCRVHPESLRAEDLDDVSCTLWCALRLGIQRHSSPEPTVEHIRHRVFLHVVDEHAIRLELGIAIASMIRSVPFRLSSRCGV